MSSRSLFRKFLHETPRGRAFAIEAAVALFVASIAISLLPFRKILPRFPSASGDPGVSDDTAAAVGLAVERVSRRLPWRTVCFHEALAAQWMLRRRKAPAILHYGLSNGDELKAHAWVSLGGRVIVGEREMGGFHCVANFPEPRGTTG